VCFYAHENDFRNLVNTPDVYVVELDISGKKSRAIMKDIQFHPVTDRILHIDFLEVFEDKEVTLSIPVILNGLAIGVRNGGVLMFRRRKIVTRGFIDNFPDAIELNIEHLEIGQFIYIKDLEEDGCEFLAPDNAVVVGVKTARAAIEEEEEEDEDEDEEEEEERKAAMSQEERDKEDADKAAEVGEESEGTEDKTEGAEKKQEVPDEGGDSPAAE
jgi:large subunit ribosomal protein L25